MFRNVGEFLPGLEHSRQCLNEMRFMQVMASFWNNFGCRATCGSVCGWDDTLQVEMLWGSSPSEVIEFFLSIFLMLPATLRLWGWLNLREKSVPGTFLDVTRGGRVRLNPSPPSVSLFFRKCQILNVSQSYRPARPANETVNFTVILVTEVVLGRNNSVLYFHMSRTP